MFAVYVTNKITNHTEKAAGPFATLAEAEGRRRELGITTGSNYDLFTDEDMPPEAFKEPKAAESGVH